MEKARVVNVLKRDGSLQPFSQDKLVGSMTKAGATQSQATLVGSRVVNRLGDASTVPTSQLSGMVARSLSKVNTEASGQYISFRDQKLMQAKTLIPHIVIIRAMLWTRIDFVMQHQQQTNWCWAAATVSVSAFFNPNTPWTQCTLVNAAFGRTDCCTNGSSSSCNRAWYTAQALQLTGNLASQSSVAGTMSDVKNEVDNGRPLLVRIGWSGGGGHRVALDGYNQLLNMVAVDDPWYGPSDVDFNVFRTAYQGSGSWTDTIKVKP